MHRCTEEMQEKAVVIVESQDIARLKEPRFYKKEIGCFEAGMLVEGMVCAGVPKEILDQGVRQRW